MIAHDDSASALGPDLAIPPVERVITRRTRVRLAPWGLREYGQILKLQEHLCTERREDRIPDIWLAGEHPGVITQGVRGKAHDLIASCPPFPVFNIDRGGQTTLHNPGQLVIYPIVKTHPGMLAQARVSMLLLLSVRNWIADLFGLHLDAPKGRPGLFHKQGKVAAIGLSVRRCVSMHGIAINCCNDLTPWRAIIPCGEPGTRPRTLSNCLGRTVEPAELLDALPRLLRDHWTYETIELIQTETLAEEVLHL